MNDNDKTKTELVMENVNLRRELDDANRRADWLRDQLRRYRASRITEKERRILDMWPRFEDTGEPVMHDDEFWRNGGMHTAHGFQFGSHTVSICVEGAHENLMPNERVKRPAPEVLDADGAPIHEGDTVWEIGQPERSLTVELVARNIMGNPLIMMRGIALEFLPSELTHREPDTWQKWERDLRRGETCEEACGELIRRAKALAGVAE